MWCQLLMFSKCKPSISVPTAAAFSLQIFSSYKTLLSQNSNLNEGHCDSDSSHLRLVYYCMTSARHQEQNKLSINKVIVKVQDDP